MACPFVQDPMDEEAALRQGEFRREMILRPQIDV